MLSIFDSFYFKRLISFFCPHHHFVRSIKQWQLLSTLYGLYGLKVRYRRGCTDQTKCSCYLSHGWWTTRHLCPFSDYVNYYILRGKLNKSSQTWGCTQYWVFIRGALWLDGLNSTNRCGSFTKSSINALSHHHGFNSRPANLTLAKVEVIFRTIGDLEI